MRGALIGSRKSEACPLLRQARAGAPLAFCRGRAITTDRFLQDVAHLSAALPSGRYVLNLCMDRYRFAVALAAALCREQVTLLPPDDKPATIRAIADGFAEVYCVSDTTAPPNVPSFAYPPMETAPSGAS